MKVAIHQPNYLPSLNGLGSFWPKAEMADAYILLDTVKFSDSEYTHRALLPNGHTTRHNTGKGVRRNPYLTVSCRHPRLGKLIKDVEIDWRTYRPHNHIKVLESTCRLLRRQLTPYINALRYTVDDIGLERVPDPNHKNGLKIPEKWRSLAYLNTHLIQYIGEEKGIDMLKFRRASEITEVGKPDDVDAEDYLPFLLDMVGATEYLTGPSWRKYAPNLEEVLKQHRIKLEEVKTGK